MAYWMKRGVQNYINRPREEDDLTDAKQVDVFSGMAFMMTVGSAILLLVGMSLLWHQALVQTPEELRYEGVMNIANFHIFSFAFPVFGCATILVLHSAGFLPKFDRAKTYTMMVFTFVTFWGTGVDVSPLSGTTLSWATLSIPNINAVRLGWEEDSDTIQALGFQRNGAVFQNLGLDPFTMPVEHSVKNQSDERLLSEVDREDFREVLAGLIITLIALGIILRTAIGRYAGVPFYRNDVSQNVVLTAFFSFALGLIATFVLWTTNAAADPNHPFYETVLGMATYSALIGLLTMGAVVCDDHHLAELAIFFVGFFGLSSPIKLFQIQALAETDLIHPFVYDDTANLSSQRTVELDRYKVGMFISILSSLVALGAGIEFLKQSDVSKYGERLEEMKGRKYFALLSGALAVIGASLQISATDDALGSIEADDQPRHRAAWFYLFLIILAWVLFAIQAFTTPKGKESDGLQGSFDRIVLGLQPLWWVAAGITVSVIGGYSNVGIHDRQMWMIDNSFAGVNELRSYMQKDDFVQKRAFDVEESTYRKAFAGTIMYYLALPLSLLISSNLSGFSLIPEWVQVNMQNKDRIVGTAGSYVLCMLFGLIGLVCLLNAEHMAEPTIHQASNSTPAVGQDVELCKGDAFNLFVDSKFENCFEEEQTLAGERFTLNIMQPALLLKSEGRSAFYGVTYYYAGMLLISLFAYVHGFCTYSIRAVKLSVIATIPLWNGLAWAFYLGLCDGDEPNPRNCRVFKSGLSFAFLYALFVWHTAPRLIASCMRSSAIMSKRASQSTLPQQEESQPAALPTTQPVASQAPPIVHIAAQGGLQTTEV